MKDMQIDDDNDSNPFEAHIQKLTLQFADQQKLQILIEGFFYIF